jgi:hypothetical protein
MDKMDTLTETIRGYRFRFCCDLDDGKKREPDRYQRGGE